MKFRQDRFLPSVHSRDLNGSRAFWQNWTVKLPSLYAIYTRSTAISDEVEVLGDALRSIRVVDWSRLGTASRYCSGSSSRVLTREH